MGWQTLFGKSPQRVWLALLLVVASSFPANAQDTELPEVIDFRTDRIRALQITIMTEERKHEVCPPGTNELEVVCAYPGMGNPDTALRGEGAFMVSIGPPAEYVEPGVGRLTEDNWKDRHYCGGTLIAPGWVVSAAHCITREKVTAGFRVRLGMTNLALSDGKHFQIDRIVCFKDSYCDQDRPHVLYQDDIALIHFKADPEEFAAALGPEYYQERGVNVAALSSDEREIITWSEDGTLRRWDAGTGAERVRDEVPASTYFFRQPMVKKTFDFPEEALRLFPDTQIVSAHRKRALTWQSGFDEIERRSVTALDFKDLSPPSPQVRRVTLGNVFSLRFSSDGEYLVVFDEEAGLQAGALENDGSWLRWVRNLEVDWPAFDEPSNSYDLEAAILEVGPKSAVIATADIAEILDADSGELLARLEHPADIAWNGRGPAETNLGTRNLVFAGKVVSGGSQALTVTRRFSASDIWLWDLATGTVVQRFAQEHARISEYAQDAILLSGGRHMLSWSQYGTLHFWDVASGQPISSMDQRLAIEDVMLAKEDTIAAVRDDAGITVWDLRSGKQLGRMDHLNWVYGAVLSPDGATALTWSEDASARIWSLEDGQELQRIYHNGAVNGAQFSDDARRILSWSSDGTARLTASPDGKIESIVDIARNPPGSPLALPVNERPERKAEVSYLPIASADFDLDTYGRVRLYGWGKTRNVEGWQPYASLMRIDLEVLDNDECRKIEGMETSRRVPRVNPYVFCGRDDRQKTCKGDSGGPVIEGGVLVGIVSWGKSTCGGTGEPGVYVRLPKYADWIREQIGEDAGLTVLDAPPSQ